MSTRYAIAAALLVGCASTAPTSWREHDDVRAMQGPGSDHVAAPAAVDAQPVLNVVVATKNEPPPSATKVDPTVDPKIIAVLLPLSGPHAAVGREFKAAIELAGDADSKRMYFDTAGDADKAALAVADAEHSGAVAILGPVGQHEAAAAAAAATKLGIPIALLAPADGADPVAGVFRVIESPADEARFAARIAAERSFTTVGVWVPNDDVGNETADAFVAEANALGLTVTSRGSYDPTAKDLQPAVEQLLGLNPETNPRYKTFIARNGRRSKKAFTPDVPFGLLYLPDRYDRSALIASFLPYLGVETRNSDFPDTEMLRRKHNGRVPQIVQLLGGSGWHHPSLPIRGGAAVEGAWVLDWFVGDLDAGMPADFASAFHDATGQVATATTAQVYDAARAVFAARATLSSGELRAGFRRALAHVHLEDGACGAEAMDPDGELQRAPTVLQVTSGQFEVSR